MIPYSRQSVSAEDIAAVDAVLASDYLTQGPAVPAFEAAVSEYCGVPEAVAVSSGTAALHLACAALDLGPGDELWTTPVSFVASANCARYCGARVDFVDIDPVTLNLDPAALARKLEDAATRGRRPKAVVVVHFAGTPCDLEAVSILSGRYGFAVIEDAAHALGAEYRGGRIGGAHYSRMAVLSFHAIKLITTGEGGMITTRDPQMARRLRTLRTHGITRDPGEMAEADPGGWYYEQRELGFNYRMTDFQAALGHSQLKRAAEFLDRRRALAHRYDRLLADMLVHRPAIAEEDHSAWHLYVIRVPPERRRAVYDAMRADGIGVNVHYIPIHLQPYYRELGFRRGDFPVAEAYYAEALTLPLHPRLSDAEQERIVAALRSALI